MLRPHGWKLNRIPCSTAQVGTRCCVVASVCIRPVATTAAICVHQTRRYHCNNLCVPDLTLPLPQSVCIGPDTTHHTTPTWHKLRNPKVKIKIQHFHFQLAIEHHAIQSYKHKLMTCQTTILYACVIMSGTPNESNAVSKLLVNTQNES